MTQTEIFIVAQTLWDFFLIVVGCGIACWWLTFWLMVWSDEPLCTETNNLSTKLILKCRELRRKR